MFGGCKELNIKSLFYRSARKQKVLLLAGVALLAGCGAAGQDQTVADYGIAYIKRPIPTMTDQDTNEVVPVDPDIREAVEFNAGGDVYFRDRASPTASERNITFCITGGVGDVKDLESSYDGTKLIFSLREEDPDPNDDFIPKWNIYEYDTTVGGCPTPVLPPGSTLADKGNSLAPAYLPDGRIVFSSSLARATGAILLDEGHGQFQPLDENQNEPALTLHVMSADGTDVRQISFNQSHDLDPTVLASGEILFSRWDHMGSRNAINLYKIRPDGTELAAVYGVHDHAVGTDNSTVQFLSPRELPDGRILAMLKPFTGSAGGGAPVLIDAANYADNTQPTWPNMGMLSGPGQVSAIDLDVRTDGSISPAGRFRSVYPLWDGTNRALVSWSQCRLQPTDPVTGLRDETADPVPCPDTIPTGAVEAFPLYGIYIYDIDRNTQLPVVVPEEGIMIDEPVVLAPRDLPTILFDKAVGFELDQELAESENVGVLHIRSVYDFDGSFNALGGSAASLAEMANPTLTDADQRPARFLRIVKAASIPDTDVYNFDNTAFGRSRQQKMREIIGYAPIEADGSVMTKVPANVPLAISVVDKDGRRIGARHQNWIQVRPGETVQCNGCHDHNPTAPAVPLPHGYRDGPVTLNSGAATGPMEFPGTTTDIDPDPMIDTPIVANMGETMAEARIRNLCGSNRAQVACPQLSPKVNPDFTDTWANGAIPDVLDRRYADLTLTDLPATAGCQSTWDARCRIVINYETHIHPLWSMDRGARTCTTCHNDKDGGGMAMVPAGQIDLSDGPFTDEPDHFKSYRELLFQDIEQELVGGVLQDVTDPVVVQATDANGNLLFETDPVTGELLLDAMGNPIPVLTTIDVPRPAAAPPMSVNGSRSGTFMSKFLAGGSHAGDLTPAELRLIAEWLDIGAQYYNSPFDAPEN
jgi:hypothetical protein